MGRIVIGDWTKPPRALLPIPHAGKVRENLQVNQESKLMKAGDKSKLVDNAKHAKHISIVNS